jgi:hypothetical protein
MSRVTANYRRLTPTVVARHDEFDLALLQRAAASRERLSDLYTADARDRDAALWSQVESLLRMRLGEPSPEGQSWGRHFSVWGDGIQPLDLAWPRFEHGLLNEVLQLLTGRFAGFSAALYFYDGPLGSGADRMGALWFNDTEILVTRSMVERLRLPGGE